MRSFVTGAAACFAFAATGLAFFAGAAVLCVLCTVAMSSRAPGSRAFRRAIRSPRAAIKNGPWGSPKGCGNLKRASRRARPPHARSRDLDLLRRDLRRRRLRDADGQDAVLVLGPRLLQLHLGREPDGAGEGA